MTKLAFYNEGENLIIRLGSVIDASNAANVEKELFRIRSENVAGALVLDATNLTYISSAGLRSVLKLQKQEKNMTVVNASKEVYDTGGAVL